MIHRHGRSNARLGKPIALRCVVRATEGPQAGTPMDPVQVGPWRIATLDFASSRFDPLKHIIHTIPSHQIHRIRQGVYETILPATVCRTARGYYDALTTSNNTDNFVEKNHNAFRVHKSLPPRQGYVTVAQVRAACPELHDEQAFSDERINESIAQATGLLHRWTGRWFSPRRMTLMLDGSGTNEQPLPHPLMHLEGAVPLCCQKPWGNPDVQRGNGCGQQTPAGGWDNPCLTDMFFPRGRRNILVQGLFGTTDDEGEPPAAIRQATVRLVARDLLEPGCAGPLVSEHTDGHSYQLAVSGAAQGACFSGDPEVDAIVRAHARPPALGHVA